MNYKLYNEWRKANTMNKNSDYQASDLRAKNFLRGIAEDDIVKKMIGIKMLNEGIIDNNLMDILLLKQIKNYF